MILKLIAPYSFIQVILQYNINLTLSSYQKLKLTVIAQCTEMALALVTALKKTLRPATPKKTAHSTNSNYGSKTKQIATYLSSKQPGICKVCFQNHRTSTGKINEQKTSEKISGTLISLPSSETRVHFMM
jgi:hypothetical protein